MSTTALLRKLNRTLLSWTALAACMLACGLGVGCRKCTAPPPAGAGDAPGPARTVGTADVAMTDPNCQITVAAGGPINNYFGAPTPNQSKDATNAIAALDFGDLYRLPPFRINGPANLVRLDVQGAIAGGGRNWQVQVNGVNGNSTISHMLIAGTLAGASTPERQGFVQRSARNALVQSLATGNTYNVTGLCN